MRSSLPLRYSMPLVLALLGLVLVLLAFLDGLQRSEQLIQSESRSHLMIFGTRVSASFERSYASNDTNAHAHMLLRSASEPHLRVAMIVDALGGVMQSTDPNRVGKTLSEFAAPEMVKALPEAISTLRVREYVDADGMTLAALFPFALPAARGELRSQRYAALYLENDLSGLMRKNLAWHVERAWVMSGVVALVLALVWIYFSVSVTKRLGTLTEAMQRVTLGDLTERAVAASGRDELGQLGQGFAVMLREIRHRRHALSASEERWRSIIQTMGEGVVTLDASGRIVTFNDSAARIAGLTSELVGARTVFDRRWVLSLEDGRRIDTEHMPETQVLRTGQSVRNFVVGVRRTDGELRWVSMSCEPLLIGGVHERIGPDTPTIYPHNNRGVLVILSDITDRRDAELQSRRDRERLAAIVDSAMDGVICTDGQFLITVFNRAAERMFGHTAATMLSQPIDRLLPDCAAYLDASVGDAAQHGSAGRLSMPGELVGRRANAEEFPLEASVSRVSLGSETILTVILRDLSERKQAEEQRAHLEAQLRQSQKMESLGTLTSGIAHDFNNILTVISGNAKLAQEELGASGTAPVQRNLLEIAKAAGRATELVRQVLTFSRQEKPERIPLDLSKVTVEAIAFLRRILPAMIEIRSHLPDDLPLTAVDATQIHQVITNLGSNAAHAIGDRIGVIEMRLDDVTVDTDVMARSPDLRSGRYVRLTVIDDGRGMDSKVLPRIFEPFFTTKSLGQGTGLGLSVVHGIVRNHEGAILVSSEPGRGTRFEVYFPALVAVEATAAAIVTPPVDAHTARRGIILYIDDEEALVYLVTRILERRGHRVLGFTDATAALDRLAQEADRIDAVVSDLAMPVLSGFDVARRVRQLYPHLPIVLVSGYVRPEDAALAQRIGVARLILKPDSVEGLADALSAVLLDAAAAMPKSA